MDHRTLWQAVGARREPAGLMLVAAQVKWPGAPWESPVCMERVRPHCPQGCGL